MENLFLEISGHLLKDDTPSQYFKDICSEPRFSKYPLNMLCELKKTEQSPKYHPEGSVWNHTMLVLDEAAKVRNKSKAPLVFMWAALLHDIGKPDTTRKRKGKITAYDHDKIGAGLARKFLEEFTRDEEFIKKVTALIRWHMQILYVVKDLPFSDVKTMKEESDLEEVALLSWCDRMGRTGAQTKEEEKSIQLFLQKCSYREI